MTGASGFIKSYGWDGAIQVAGTTFSYCVRREKGYCSITYAEVQGQTIGMFSYDLYLPHKCLLQNIERQVDPAHFGHREFHRWVSFPPSI